MFRPVTRINPDGITTTTSAVADDVVGPKSVTIQAEAREPVTWQNVVIATWPAGHRAAERSEERLVDRAVAAGTVLAVPVALPGAESWGLCEGACFTVSASYRRAKSRRVGCPLRGTSRPRRLNSVRHWATFPILLPITPLRAMRGVIVHDVRSHHSR
jgi:hypothetical protein